MKGGLAASISKGELRHGRIKHFSERSDYQINRKER